jgi:hypothetical protein
MTRRTYDDWIADVDRHVQRSHGVSLGDLSDAPTAEYYDAGLCPAEAAKEAIAFTDGCDDY